MLHCAQAEFTQYHDSIQYHRARTVEKSPRMAVQTQEHKLEIGCLPTYSLQRPRKERVHRMFTTRRGFSVVQFPAVSLPVALAVTLILVVSATAQPASSPAQRTSETDDRLQQALQRFPQADLNKDGVLTVTEAKEFVEARRAAADWQEAQLCAGDDAQVLSRRTCHRAQDQRQAVRPRRVCVGGKLWIGGK